MPTANAKVMFKRGTQAALNTLIAGSGNRFDEGTFYLTNDTNRLYFAQEASKLVDLNQYIHIDSNITKNDITSKTLPTRSTSGYENLQDGDIYYWSDPNILAICDSAQTGTWTQLNADTRLVSNNGGAITFSTGTNAVTLTTTIEDSATNSATGSFTITGGSNVTVTNSGTNITISAANDTDDTHYALDTSNPSTGTGVQLNLAASDRNGNALPAAASSTVLVKGGGAVTVSRENDGSIKINGSGGVRTVGNRFNETGGFITTLNTSDGEITSIDNNVPAIVPTITYGNSNSESAVFANGTAALSVYTKTEVDNKIQEQLKAFDAMEFGGVLANQTAADTALVATITANETPKKGTTYKAGGNITIPAAIVTAGSQATAKAGDLIIAEGADGNVTWTVIPSGDDQAVSGEIEGTGININDNSGTLAGIRVNGSTNAYGTISATASADGNVNTITIAHGAAGTGTAVTPSAADTNTTQSPTTALTVPIISSISKDSAGHITSISSQNYVLKDTHVVLKELRIGTSVTNNEAQVTFNIDEEGEGCTHDSGIEQIFKITSNNLKLQAATEGDGTNTVNIDLVWGSFGTT